VMKTVPPSTDEIALEDRTTQCYENSRWRTKGNARTLIALRVRDMFYIQLLYRDFIEIVSCVQLTAHARHKPFASRQRPFIVATGHVEMLHNCTTQVFIARVVKQQYEFMSYLLTTW
jgi:hypothetical protein